MPNLVKDPSPPRRKDEPIERNLFLQPNSSKYYAKKYIAELGKERVKCLETKDRHTAIILKNQVIAQWEGARRDEDGSVVFDGPAFELLQIMTTKAEKTFLDYEGALRLHLLPFFTGKPLRQCSREWSLYKARQRQLTPGRQLKHDKKALARIFSHAVDRGLIDAVPRFRLDREDTRVQRQVEYSNDELALLLSKAKPKLALKIETLLKTAMRANELRNLRYDWINWETGEVTIPAALTKMRVERVVVLDDELLRKYRERFERAKPSYAFPHRDDPSKPASVTDKDWQRLIKELGIQKKRHWLRGSAVRRAIRSGVPESTAQATAGMSDAVFRRVYYDADTSDRKKFTEAVAKSLRNDPESGSNATNPGGRAGNEPT
jgi:integrase